MTEAAPRSDLENARRAFSSTGTALGVDVGGTSRRFAQRSRSKGDVDAAAVITRAGEGDVVAAAVWQEAVDSLARILRDVQKLIDVELIVLGGGLSMAGESLTSALSMAMVASCGVATVPRLRVFSIGQQAGLLGAGIAALDAHDAEQA